MTAHQIQQIRLMVADHCAVEVLYHVVHEMARHEAVVHSRSTDENATAYIKWSNAYLTLAKDVNDAITKFVDADAKR